MVRNLQVRKCSVLLALPGSEKEKGPECLEEVTMVLKLEGIFFQAGRGTALIQTLVATTAAQSIQGWRGISRGLLWAAGQVQEHKLPFCAAKLRLKNPINQLMKCQNTQVLIEDLL